MRPNGRGRRALRVGTRGADSSMIVEQPGFWLAVLQIIWIDILLSGDNAVVIALACRKLPSRQRGWGIVLGTLVDIRLLVLWIAVKFLGPEENGKSGEVEPVDNLWRAVRIIAIADVVMSLDNVIAIAAVAERFEAPHNYALLMFGLAVSIPLIMAGAALLGWIAGEIIAKDPLFTANLDPATAHTAWIIGATLGALFVVGAALVRRRWLRPSAPD